MSELKDNNGTYIGVVVGVGISSERKKMLKAMFDTYDQQQSIIENYKPKDSNKLPNYDNRKVKR